MSPQVRENPVALPEGLDPICCSNRKIPPTFQLFEPLCIFIIFKFYHEAMIGYFIWVSQPSDIGWLSSLFWFPSIEITLSISYTKNVFRSIPKHSHCFTLRGILWRGCFSPSSPYLLFLKTSLFFEIIVVVTIGTPCCSDVFFYSK